MNGFFCTTTSCIIVAHLHLPRIQLHAWPGQLEFQVSPKAQLYFLLQNCLVLCDQPDVFSSLDAPVVCLLLPWHCRTCIQELLYYGLFFPCMEKFCQRITHYSSTIYTHTCTCALKEFLIVLGTPLWDLLHAALWTVSVFPRLNFWPYMEKQLQFYTMYMVSFLAKGCGMFWEWYGNVFGASWHWGWEVCDLCHSLVIEYGEKLPYHKSYVVSIINLLPLFVSDYVSIVARRNGL